MDFKGITWAGNIYQKFEAMCLEVEEAMYQDTVKYVENQAQKVGISVKKFYSEVMEDLLPSSCVGPINLASGDLSLNPCGDIDVIKKPTPGIFDSPGDIKHNENEDQLISNETAEKATSLSGGYDIKSLCPRSPGTLVQNKFSDSCAGINKKIGVHRRPVGIKRISKNNHPSKDSSQVSSLSGDMKKKLPSTDMRISSRAASDDINLMMSPLDLNVSREPGEMVKGNAPFPVTPVESHAPNKILAAEPVRQNEDDLDCISPSPAKNFPFSAEPVRQNRYDSDSLSPASDNNLSAESERLKGDPVSTSSCCGLPAESNGTYVNDVSFSLSCSTVGSKACNLESDDREVILSNEGMSMKDGSSSISVTSCEVVSWDQEIITSNEDSFNMEIIENDEVPEPRSENFEPVESINLEESCVLLEGDNLDTIPHETRKHKSYKKKIRKALLSKFRSRKDTYCVSELKDMVVKNDAEAGKENPPAHDSFESEWELL